MSRAPLLVQHHGTPNRSRPQSGGGGLKLSTLFVIFNFFILLAVVVVLYFSMSAVEDTAHQGKQEPVRHGGAGSADEALPGDPEGGMLFGDESAQQQHGDGDGNGGRGGDPGAGAEEEEDMEEQLPPPPELAGNDRKPSASPAPEVPPPVKVDIPQAEVIRPLSGKYATLWEELKTKQHAVLSLPRLTKSARISCGGTGTMGFRTWNEIKTSTTQINQTLPVRALSVPALVSAVEKSPCWKTSKYKKPGCEFFVPLTKHEEEPLCAVVGNSGKLRYQNWQNEIDSCDIVIRFNNGVTKGFEKHVGTKSSIRLYNGPYVSPKQPGEITIAEMRDLAIRHWVKTFTKRPPGEALAFVMDPELICHSWEWVNRAGEKPSSGIVGMMLALNLCRHVHVFGFSATDYFDKTMRPHYYDWERPKPGREDVHPFAQEARIYQMLQDAGKLTLHE